MKGKVPTEILADYPDFCNLAGILRWPDTADLREVREFGREPGLSQRFTQEPPDCAAYARKGCVNRKLPDLLPQTDIERRAFLRQATPKGEYGKLSEYSSLARHGNRSLSGSDELRKLLDPPEMPPYRGEQSGKTTEWTMPHSKRWMRSRNWLGLTKDAVLKWAEGLLDAWRTLTKAQRARERQSAMICGIGLSTQRNLGRSGF